MELPPACLPGEIAERIVGRGEVLEQSGASRWRVVPSYDPVTCGDEFPQLLNLLFGNISLKSGIL